MKIFLIGPMGSGKSKIGRILSEKLSISLFDIDKEIEKDLNMSITEIFASKGEIFFRQDLGPELNLPRYVSKDSKPVFSRQENGQLK